MASTLVLIYFGRRKLGHTIKTNFRIFYTDIQLNFDFL